MTKYRKMIAAFILPLLALPISEWIAGNGVFDKTTVLQAVGAALVAAVGVYFTPNTT